MNVSRRSVLEAGFCALALPTVAASGTPRTAPVTLVVYDSRSGLSRGLSERYQATAIDVARDSACRWQDLRTSRPSGRVVGLTTWTDFVQARGVLGEQRKRLRVEARVGGLLYWEIA
jgi:hypothetical protein